MPPHNIETPIDKKESPSTCTANHVTKPATTRPTQGPPTNPAVQTDTILSFNQPLCQKPASSVAPRTRKTIKVFPRCGISKSEPLLELGLGTNASTNAAVIRRQISFKSLSNSAAPALCFSPSKGSSRIEPSITGTGLLLSQLPYLSSGLPGKKEPERRQGVCALRFNLINSKFGIN